MLRGWGDSLKLVWVFFLFTHSGWVLGAQPLKAVVPPPEQTFQIPIQAVYTAIGAFVLFFLKELWSWIKHGASKEYERMTVAINKNNDETHRLTNAIIKLETQMEHLSKGISELPRIKSGLMNVAERLKKVEEVVDDS